MKHLIATFALLALLCTGCSKKLNPAEVTPVPYTYSLVEVSQPTAVIIRSSEEFLQRFGQAAVKGGPMPSIPDFTRYAVVALQLPPTYMPTEVTAIRFDQRGRELLMRYRIKQSPATAHTMTPLVVLTVPQSAVQGITHVRTIRE